MNLTLRESGLGKKGPICMTKLFKNFQPFCMNLKKFRNHVYEFSRFEDARSIQIYSVVIKIPKKLPIPAVLRLKIDPFEGNFR